MRTYLPFIFALGTAVCWGLYGPTLGRARIGDPLASPFKPYVGIGMAYLIIAIVGGLVGMYLRNDSFEPTGPSAVWGFAAGILGALGAFNLTLCMFSGGARIPHAVMPVVFGGAVTVTALFTVWRSAGELHISPGLWIGIAGMLLSVVVITMNTPHAAPPGAHEDSSAKVEASSTPPPGEVEPGG